MFSDNSESPARSSSERCRKLAALVTPGSVTLEPCGGWWQCWVPSVCYVTLGRGEKPLNLSLAFGPHECLLDEGLNQRVNESPLVTQLLTGLGRERAVGEGTRAWVSS